MQRKKKKPETAPQPEPVPEEVYPQITVDYKEEVVISKRRSEYSMGDYVTLTPEEADKVLSGLLDIVIKRYRRNGL